MTGKNSSELERQLSNHLAPGAYLTTTGRSLVMEVREQDTGGACQLTLTRKP